LFKDATGASALRVLKKLFGRLCRQVGVVFFDLRLLAAKNKNSGSRKCFPDTFFRRFSGFLDVFFGANLEKLARFMLGSKPLHVVVGKKNYTIWRIIFDFLGSKI
jgi:hypothetical protein